MMGEFLARVMPACWCHLESGRSRIVIVGVESIHTMGGGEKTCSSTWASHRSGSQPLRKVDQEADFLPSPVRGAVRCMCSIFSEPAIINATNGTIGNHYAERLPSPGLAP